MTIEKLKTNPVNYIIEDVLNLNKNSIHPAQYGLINKILKQQFKLGQESTMNEDITHGICKELRNIDIINWQKEEQERMKKLITNYICIEADEFIVSMGLAKHIILYLIKAEKESKNKNGYTITDTEIAELIKKWLNQVDEKTYILEKLKGDTK